MCTEVQNKMVTGEEPTWAPSPWTDGETMQATYNLATVVEARVQWGSPQVWDDRVNFAYEKYQYVLPYVLKGGGVLSILKIVQFASEWMNRHWILSSETYWLLNWSNNFDNS